MAPAAADGLLDVVTGDYVADALVRFLEAPEAGGTYHVVAGINALTVATLRDLAARTFDMPPIELGGEADGVYTPYFDVRCRFDDTRARAVLRPVGICPRQITAPPRSTKNPIDTTRRPWWMAGTILLPASTEAARSGTPIICGIDGP